MKKIGLALLATMAVALGVSSAASAQYDISVVPDSPPAGEPASVAVQGCVPGEEVTVNLPGFTPSTQTGSADAAGNANFDFGSPDQAGTFPGEAQCGVLNSSFTVTVTAPAPPTTPGGGLPATGSSGQSSTALMAGGLLVVGLGLFAVAQVRRRQATVA